MALLPTLETTRTLIDELFAEQNSLTAVERFSRHHESAAVSSAESSYRALLPQSPKAGQQYAFEVDLDQCSGCKACVVACHSLNGLSENESWRNVGALHEIDTVGAVQLTVTTACHHCVDPGCLNGCPVLAYEKDPITGIVRHLDDQCIGCQYCILKCPYDAPKFNVEKGIVRKCDMCTNRLAVGEAPACVQACPNEAIRITLVDKKELSEKFAAAISHGDTNSFLSSSPDPALTIPTTRFLLANPGRQLQSADAYDLRPQEPHLPLVWMLVLSQMSVGLFAWSALAEYVGSTSAVLSLLTRSAAAVAISSLLVSGLHLGRPLGAWRAFLGLRRSWLSREIVVLGAYGSLAGAAAFETFAPNLVPGNSALLLPLATLSGLLGVFCSQMVYVDTGRVFWNARITGLKFFGTVGILGSAGVVGIATYMEATDLLALASSILVAITTLKLFWEWLFLRRRTEPITSELGRSARLLSGPMFSWWRARFILGIAGGIFAPAILLSFPNFAMDQAMGWAALLCCLAGELIERRLFFTAVSPTRMPGALR